MGLAAGSVPSFASSGDYNAPLRAGKSVADEFVEENNAVGDDPARCAVLADLCWMFARFGERVGDSGKKEATT